MAIVRTDIPTTAQLSNDTILALTERYPEILRSELLGETAFGRPIRTLVIGNGQRKVIYTAAHHANEWITTPVLLKFVEEFATAIENGGEIGGVDARALSNAVTIYTVPMVDPDGVDLVTGAIQPGQPQYELAAGLAQHQSPQLGQQSGIFFVHQPLHQAGPRIILRRLGTGIKPLSHLLTPAGQHPVAEQKPLHHRKQHQRHQQQDDALRGLTAEHELLHRLQSQRKSPHRQQHHQHLGKAEQHYFLPGRSSISR